MANKIVTNREKEVQKETTANLETEDIVDPNPPEQITTLKIKIDTDPNHQAVKINQEIATDMADHNHPTTDSLKTTIGVNHPITVRSKIIIKIETDQIQLTNMSHQVDSNKNQRTKV